MKTKDVLLPYTNEDGSLNFDSIMKVSVGKFEDIIGAMNQTQNDEYWEYISNLPRQESQEPVIPILINEECEKGIEERHTQNRQFREEEKAAQIAEIYLKEHPRRKSFLINLCSSTEDSEGSYYKELNKKEITAIKEWEENIKGKVSLDEYLKRSNRELYERLIDNNSLYALDRIDSYNLNDIRSYSQCEIREFNPETDEYRVYNSSFPLSDREFLELLADRIASYQSLSMNSVVVYHPEMAQRIMRHIICLTGMVYENYNPFIIIFTEIDNAFNEILRNENELPDDLQVYIKFRSILG